MIKLVRIDHRLLHGQVVFAWVNRLNINRIIVVDDAAANDEFKKMSLKLAKPNDVKLNILTVEDALNRKEKIKKLPENVAVILGNTKSCMVFCKELTDTIKEINYGGIPKKAGSIEYDKAVYLNADELEDSKQLKTLGFRLYSQQTPTNTLIELNDKF
jgi:PTS system mannose-specific IIB component